MADFVFQYTGKSHKNQNCYRKQQIGQGVLVDMYHLWEEGYEVVEGIKSKRGKENPFYRLFKAVKVEIAKAMIHVFRDNSTVSI